MIARNKSLKSSVPHHFPTTFRISELFHHFPITPSSIIKSPHALFSLFRDGLVGQPIIVTILLLPDLCCWISHSLFSPISPFTYFSFTYFKLHKVSVEVPRPHFPPCLSCLWMEWASSNFTRCQLRPPPVPFFPSLFHIYPIHVHPCSFYQLRTSYHSFIAFHYDTNFIDIDILSTSTSTSTFYRHFH